MIVVTGLMRSGTSPVAQMLHQMGVEMGEFMRFPTQSPVAHFEWEDAALAEPLVSHLLGHTEIDTSRLLRGYILSRKSKRWGVKTPFLLPFMADFRQIAMGLGHKLRVVLMYRDYDETLKSLERQYEHLPLNERMVAGKNIMQLQDRLRAALDKGPHHALQVNHSDLRTNPRSVAEQLARVAEIDVDLDVATRGIWGA